MKARERTVYFFDLEIFAATREKNIPNGAAACIPITRALKIASEVFHSAPQFRRGQTEMVVIRDMQFDDQTRKCFALINRADRNVADVAFTDFDLQSVRYAKKTTREGIDISTHVLFKPTSRPRACTMLLTTGAGLTAHQIVVLLNRVIRLASANPNYFSDFNHPHPNGVVGATYKVRYRFDYKSHKSDHLAESLEKGTLVGVELVSRGHAHFDSSGVFEQKGRNIYLAPTDSVAKMTVGKLRSAILGTSLDDAFGAIDTIKVRVKDKTGHTHTQSFSPNDLEAAYTKRRRIDFAQDLPSHHTAIDPVIITEMDRLS